MEGPRHYFHPVDYVILSVSLAVSLGVGIYQSLGKRHVKTTTEYHTGGRMFGIIPVALSLVASFMSSIALLGSPAEAYFFGIQGVLGVIGMIGGGCISAWLFIPLLHPLKLVSAQEYLERRYKSKTIRLLGTFLCVLKQLLYTGCVVYGQAAALEATTGLPSWVSIIIVNILATVYTAVGGIKAVIWTDVFQVLIMFGSMIVIIIIGLVKIGGPGRMWQVSQDWGRMELSLDPGIYTRLTLWNMTIAGTVGWTTIYGVVQTSVQRYSSIRDMGKARRSMVGNTFGTTALSTICFFTGLVVFAYYTDLGCDPYHNHVIHNKNQILPYFIMDVLGYPGLPGVFVSGLFCGSLSTLSSCISAMCAVVWEDIQRPIFGDNLPQVKQLLVNKITAVCIGVAGLGITFLVNGIGGSLVQISAAIGGLSSGPILGMFVLGALFPWANWKGAFSGSVVSLIVVSTIFGGQIVFGTHSYGLPTRLDKCIANSSFANVSNTDSTTLSFMSATSQLWSNTSLTNNLMENKSFMQEWVYSISYMWFGVIGLVLSILFGVVFSIITGLADPSTVEKELLFHFLRNRYGKDKEENKKDKVMEPFLEAEMKSIA